MLHPGEPPDARGHQVRRQICCTWGEGFVHASLRAQLHSAAAAHPLYFTTAIPAGCPRFCSPSCPTSTLSSSGRPWTPSASEGSMGAPAGTQIPLPQISCDLVQPGCDPTSAANDSPACTTQLPVLQLSVQYQFVLCKWKHCQQGVGDGWSKLGLRSGRGSSRVARGGHLKK